MKICDDRYAIEYVPETGRLVCHGSLRLYGGAAHASVVDLLDAVADSKPARIVFDIRDLHFVNSSGINVFYKFILRIRDEQSIRLEVIGVADIFWQPKVMINFQRLLPDIQVAWETGPEPGWAVEMPDDDTVFAFRRAPTSE